MVRVCVERDEVGMGGLGWACLLLAEPPETDSAGTHSPCSKRNKVSSLPHWAEPGQGASRECDSSIISSLPTGSGLLGSMET